MKLADGGTGLEKALANQQKADIYSIHFSYNSDVICDESTPTLKEIADIMTRHPDWRLAVNGHTDGIGSDQFNGELSKRRAAAVVTALVTRYHIDAARLNPPASASPNQRTPTTRWKGARVIGVSN